MLVRICRLLLIIVFFSSFPASAYSISNWKVTLRVSGGQISTYCVLGVNSGAVDGHDYAWDIPRPPDSLNETYIDTYFPHPEWGGTFGRFRQDIKAPDLPKEWAFEVESNIFGELTVEWPDLKNAIPDKDAVLVDVDGGGGEIDMHTTSSLVFGNTGYPRRFLVRVSEGIPAPESPEGLYGKLRKGNVLLYWKRNRELDLAGYNVYRSTVPGSGYQRINYSLVVRHTYKDNEIINGDIFYYYVVTAVNAAGGESGYSNEVEVYMPPAAEPPDTPQRLRGRSSRAGVILSWERNRELDLAGYNVYRSTAPVSGYRKINASLIRRPQYRDRDITLGETYYYVVTAVNTPGGESGYSNRVKVTIIHGSSYYK